MQRAELTSRYLGTAEAEPISAATIKQSSERDFNLCMLPIVKVLLAALRGFLVLLNRSKERL
jgi:hypothetical protein